MAELISIIVCVGLIACAVLAMEYQMKHLMFLIGCTLLAAVGSLFHPFWALLLYYTWAVLRPQFLWEWALPAQVRWSLIATTILLISLFIHAPKLIDTVRINLMTVLMLAFSLLLFLCVLTAFDPGLSERWAVDYAKVMLMAIVASVLIGRVWQVRLMCFMIAASIGYIAYNINVLYFFEGNRLDVYHYGYGGLDNNGAGLMLAMGLPFTYAIAFMRGGTWNLPRWSIRLSAGLAFFLILHAVLMTYSRGAMLAVAVGVIWLVIHHRPRFQAAGLASLLVVAILMMSGPEIQHRFLSTRNYQHDESAQKRLAAWTAAWDVAWERPLLGYGIRNSNRFLAAYGADKSGRVIHNNYLQIAADSGIPAAGVYIAMLGLALWFLRKGQHACYKAAPKRTRAGPLSEKDLTKREDLIDTARVYLAIQTSLVIFTVGAMFLSVENFEFPWLLLAMAGAVPLVTRHLLNGYEQDEAPEPSFADGGLHEVTTAGQAAARKFRRWVADSRRRGRPRPLLHGD